LGDTDLDFGSGRDVNYRDGPLYTQVNNGAWNFNSSWDQNRVPSVNDDVVINGGVNSNLT